MARSARLRIAVAIATALLIGAFSAAPASAAPPPPPGTTYACQNNLPAGYVPGLVNGHAAWVWSGELGWDMCIARTSSNTHYAVFRLSSPSNLSPQFDRYTGLVWVYLQKCVNGVVTTVASMTWQVSTYIYAVSNSGGRYYFTWVTTPSTTDAATYYRLYIGGNGAVVPRNGGWYFSLSQGAYPPNGQSPGVYVSVCMQP